MNWIFFGEEELGDSDRLPLARSLRRFLKSPLQELMPPVSLSFDLFFTRSSSRSARSPLRIKTLIMKNLNESDILLSAQQNSYQGITRAKKEDNTYGFSGIAVKWPYPKHSANPQLCNHPSQTAGTYPWHPHDRQITRRIIPIPESNIQLVRHLSYFNYISRPSPHRLISAKISLPQLHLSLRQWSAILINGLGGSSADVEAAATASNGEQGEGVILMKDDRADAEFHLGDNVVATSSSFLLKDGARCGRTFNKVAAVTLRKYKGYDPIPTGIAGVESRRARAITWTSRTIMLDIPSVAATKSSGMDSTVIFLSFFFSVSTPLFLKDAAGEKTTEAWQEKSYSSSYPSRSRIIQISNQFPTLHAPYLIITHSTASDTKRSKAWDIYPQKSSIRYVSAHVPSSFISTRQPRRVWYAKHSYSYQNTISTSA